MKPKAKQTELGEKLGSVECDNATRIWVAYPTTPLVLWVYDSAPRDIGDKPAIDSRDPMDRCGGPYRISDFIDDDSSASRWFMFAVVDCYFPLSDLVRAESWEAAYEAYIDWAAEHRGIKIDEPDLKDYLDEQGEYNGSMTSDGVPVDTDNIQGSEVQLVAIEFGKGFDWTRGKVPTC